MEYGSFFDGRANLGFERSSAARLPEDWQLWRSGRDAMKALARLAGAKRVLLPALCCASMIVPFTLNGVSVEFYRLREDLRGDADDVRAKCRRGDLLLYMSYMGIQPFDDAFLERLRTDGVLLAEDRTQDIIVPRGSAGFVPDATLASLRKWAALPEGGMLQTRLGACPAGRDTAFAEACSEAMDRKARYLESGEAALKTAFLQQYRGAEALLDQDGTPAAMGAESRDILARLDFGAIYAARLRNVRRLRERLEPLRARGALRFLSNTPERSALYFPLLLEDRNAVQRAMAEKAIYCPVIWPEPAEAEGVCAVSRAVTAHMLALPVDQRYDEAQIDFFADSLVQILGI